MKFNKEDLINLANEDYSGDIEVMEDELVDSSRWSLNYRMVIKSEDNFYETHYSRGATECQDESPYEYEPNEVELEEVYPVESVFTLYTSKKV